VTPPGRVSVIVTTYNRPQYLARVLEGYLHQTRPPEEIIVADDGSTGETASMIHELQKNSPVPLFHVWHEDRGFRAGHIRNRAAARSAGDYLILADDDSIPVPTLVEDHLRNAEAGFFLQGHRVLLGPAASQTFTWHDISLARALALALRGQAGNVLNAIHLPRAMVRRSREMRGIRSCNMSFFRADFFAVNGFNEAFEGWGKEDSELAVRFYKYGLRRKDLRFQGACYHLHHAPYSRERLERNLALLAAAEQNPAWRCEKGVDQYVQR
jgi:glycosyltransferase involved in cell wall biosynthesis